MKKAPRPAEGPSRHRPSPFPARFRFRRALRAPLRPLVCTTALALLASAEELPDGGALLFPMARAVSQATATEPGPRRIAISGSSLTIPVVFSAKTSAWGQLSTVLEIANVSDADARFSLRLRGEDGEPLGMPFLDGRCPLCAPHTRSAFEASVGSWQAVQVRISAQSPEGVGWADFASDPEVSFAVSAMLRVEQADGTVSLAGIPPSDLHGRAWLYVDNTAGLSTELVLVNPAATDWHAIKVRYRSSADSGVECEASAEIAPLGQTRLGLAESLSCSANAIGLIEIRGQSEFTGIALVSSASGGVFARQFSERAPRMFPPLSQWAVSAGQVGFGSAPSGGCVTLAGAVIEGAAYTVHTSKWQRRVHAADAWTDVPGTARTAQVCPYDPTESGEYRAVADITIGDERGMFASSDVLTVEEGPAPPPAPIPGLQEYTNSLGMQFVKIPAGEFSMGATGAWGDSDERPVTRVQISQAFWMGKHEVTQDQWQAVMGSNPSRYEECGADCPVDSVSWIDVQGFVARLNEMQGETRYRLPTEAEWEYAAKADTETDTPAGNLIVVGSYNAPVLDGIAWYGGNSGVDYEGGRNCSDWVGKQYESSWCGPHPVGRKGPNQFGLHDVVGNVWEWVQDRGGHYPGGAVTDPDGPESGLTRIARGGSWGSWATSSRSANRTELGPDRRAYDFGFRLVRVDSADLTTGGPDPAVDVYTPLDDWTVSDGRVQFFLLSAGRCVSLGNTTLNGVTYTIHDSEWQKRDDATSAWKAIPGTGRTGSVCSYSPAEPGQYRGVAEISIGGERGKYSTKNILTVGASPETTDNRPRVGSATIVPANPSVGPTEAGKQARDPLVFTVNDVLGAPISGAPYRWETDEDSGWVYPPKGSTGADGRINAVWVAGRPGISSMTLLVEHGASEQRVEVLTESVESPRPPSSAINLFMHSRVGSGYSIDLTPLAEPGGTYYAAIHWDGGYTGLQRAGSRYDRQLQFSVWDADGIDAQVIRRGEGVICSPFGGEGTGQKCELNYQWRVGDSYRFEVTEEDLDGGSLLTLHVTDLASNQRTFVGAIRYGRRANLSWMNMFVEDFVRTAPTCLAQPVRSAAIRGAMALIDGSWQPVTSGTLSPHAEDAANPGTPACANVATRDHASGLEVVMGGLTAGGPLTARTVSIPGSAP